MADEKCACGKPLHYSVLATRKVVEEAVSRLGPDVVVTGPDGSYSVQRHYIALHGLKTCELETLAEKGLIKKIS
ncbi:MAG: hypothetical protein M0R50_03310 [Candidatus Cloacimonetes bacterium]|nr:hypothetical protein [Candidatus Cloacimonadota bacterium]